MTKVAEPLVISAGGLDDNGKDARLVTRYQQRNMAVDRNLSLKQLLGSGVDVRGVGEGDGSAQLFFDGDSRGGVAEHAEIIWVHLDRTGAEQALHAAADSCVERSAEECVGGGI